MIEEVTVAYGYRFDICFPNFEEDTRHMALSEIDYDYIRNQSPSGETGDDGNDANTPAAIPQTTTLPPGTLVQGNYSPVAVQDFVPFSACMWFSELEGTGCHCMSFDHRICEPDQCGSRPTC